MNFDPFYEAATFARLNPKCGTWQKSCLDFSGNVGETEQHLSITYSLASEIKFISINSL